MCRCGRKNLSYGILLRLGRWHFDIDGVNEGCQRNVAMAICLSLVCYEEEGTTTYGRCYERGNRQIRFGFDDAEGSSLAYTSYDYFFPVRLESIMTELERKGFENKGEVKFDDDNADICYLFLSADEKTEVLLSKCERNGGSWAICFQPTDINDLNHIVTRHEVILFINNIKKTVLL